jgi:hypothetical protein
MRKLCPLVCFFVNRTGHGKASVCKLCAPSGQLVHSRATAPKQQHRLARALSNARAGRLHNLLHMRSETAGSDLRTRPAIATGHCQVPASTRGPGDEVHGSLTTSPGYLSHASVTLSDGAWQRSESQASGSRADLGNGLGPTSALSSRRLESRLWTHRILFNGILLTVERMTDWSMSAHVLDNVRDVWLALTDSLTVDHS